MSILTIPYIFAPGDTSLGTKFQANFDAIKNVVNGALDENNLKPTAMLIIDSINVTGDITTSILENPTTAYSVVTTFTPNVPNVVNKFEIKNSLGNLIFYIDNDKDIYIGS